MFSLFRKTLKVATHNGDFHSDDVFACAALTIWAKNNGKNIKIIRTRDRSIIDKADMVVDVGDSYDSQKNRFDHHQRGGAGDRDGVPYASFGLVWKKFGESICGEKNIADIVEKKLIFPIDARDNGINIYKNLLNGVEGYDISYVTRAFRPTWRDDKSIARKKFDNYLHVAIAIIENEINIAKSEQLAYRKVEQSIKEQYDNPVLFLDQDIPWEKVVTNHKHIKLVIYPEPDQESFCVEVGRDDLNDYDSNRISFPESWRGKRDNELALVTGVKDSVFCHRAGFLFVVKSKEGAIKIAEMTLQSVPK